MRTYIWILKEKKQNHVFKQHDYRTRHWNGCKNGNSNKNNTGCSIITTLTEQLSPRRQPQNAAMNFELQKRALIARKRTRKRAVEAASRNKNCTYVLADYYTNESTKLLTFLGSVTPRPLKVAPTEFNSYQNAHSYLPFAQWKTDFLAKIILQFHS